MKRLLIPSLLVFLLVGCGSSSVESGDVVVTDGGASSKQDNGVMAIPSDKSYRLYDYLCPSSNHLVTSYKYKNKVFQEAESLEYTSDNTFTLERSLKNTDGKIEYKSLGDTIAVTLYLGTKTENFNMNNFLNIGDTVTLKESECSLTAHYAHLKYGEHDFADVLEISCPKSIGYYEKESGLVVENVLDESLQTSAFSPAPSYPDRKIGGIDGSIIKSSRFSSFNVDSAIEAQVDKLWGSPYNLNGEGMKIGLVDGGSVLSSHVELRNRVTNLSNADTNKHATHVAGTLISAGTHLASSRGFANKAEVYSLAYSEIYFADSVKRLANDYGIFISNHSYGYEGPEGMGEYDNESKALDLAIRENPKIIAVMAAGNDGDEYRHDSAYREWALIKGGSNAKNVITVAAVDNESNKIASFSSRGPMTNGRLKPDISLDGTNVLSTSNYDDTAYTRMDGTSMATPAATGSIALLSQRYTQVNGGNVRLDTMKAILFNTAKDIENPGPDYKSGFGQLDALAAVKVIDSMGSSNDSLVRLDSIHQDDKQRYFINSERYQDFKVTLAWVDDTYQDCNGCANDMLINDIDMVLIDERSGDKIYPYTLSETSPNRDAVKTKENHVDPQEQISFPLRVGNYTLEINGRKISPSGQNFTLVSSLSLDEAQKDIALIPMDEHVHKIYNAIK